MARKIEIDGTPYRNKPMTVEELIGELMASCNSLEDDVWLGTTPGPVLLVSGAEGLVFLNNYEEKAESNDDTP